MESRTSQRPRHSAASRPSERPIDRPPSKKQARAVERVKDAWKALCREVGCRFDVDAKAAECLPLSLKRRQFMVFTKLHDVQGHGAALRELRRVMRQAPLQLISLAEEHDEGRRVLAAYWGGYRLGTIHRKHYPWLAALLETGEIIVRAEAVTGARSEAPTAGLNIAFTCIGRALWARLGAQRAGPGEMTGEKAGQDDRASLHNTVIAAA